MTGETLGQKAVKGGAWLFAMSVVHRCLGLVRTVILARLLSPDDFGLMGIAVLAISSIDTFSKLGLEPALVQKKGDIRGYLDTTWTVQLLRAIVLFCLLYFGAPWVAGFFKSDRATDVLRALAFLELFMGAKNIGVVYFQKDMKFGRSFALGVSESAVNITTSIILAFHLRNVWALVYGSLAGSLTTLVMSYVLHPYRPRLSLETAKVGELFGFGKWLFGKSVLYFLISQGDNAFVGRVMGVTALGFYQMAYNLSLAPFSAVLSIAAVVMFPVYSMLQDDASKLRKAFLESLQLNMFILMPVAAGMTVLAGDFTVIFLGAKWAPIITPLVVLVFAALLVSIIVLAGNVFYGAGRPKLDTLWEAIRLLVFAALIYPLTARWGIAGTAAAVLAGAAVGAIGFIYNVLALIRLGKKEFLLHLAYPFVSSIVMAAVVLALRSSLGCAGMAGFLALVAAGIAVYALTNFIFVKYGGYGIYNIIKNRLRPGAA